MKSILQRNDLKHVLISINQPKWALLFNQIRVKVQIEYNDESQKA
jgi:hypothetical protein